MDYCVIFTRQERALLKLSDLNSQRDVEFIFSLQTVNRKQVKKKITWGAAKSLEVSVKNQFMKSTQ